MNYWALFPLTAFFANILKARGCRDLSIKTGKNKSVILEAGGRTFNFYSEKGLKPDIWKL